mgnify:CR=1 FL=1
MAKLVAFYSRADENYFGGSMKYIQIGNTEKVAKMIAKITGADLFKIEPDGRFLKHIKFRFPVYFGDRETQELCWDNESTVETVVLIQRKNM